MFGEDRLEVAGEGHVFADQHPDANYGGKAHTFVVAVANTDGKATALHAGVEVKDAEHLHAVLGNGVLLGNHTDVAKAQGLDQSLDDLGMRHRTVSRGAQRRLNGCQLLTGQLCS